MPENSDIVASIDNNLPVQLTPLIGREAEVALVTEKLCHDEVRLLVLTGPGGIGKTRLGLQVAANVIGQYPDGIFYIDLEALTDHSLVIQTIARQIGIQERGIKPAADLLKDYLKVRQILLVLDTFEQVIDAGTAIADLLAACPGLKILVTSRVILRLQGEYNFTVPPLSLPDLDDLSLLLRADAVLLFAERAVAAQPEFELTTENVGFIADICNRLDALPLAIELAAARIRLMPPNKMLDRLGKSLSFLTRGAKDRPSRQQTLRGTIDWSYDLLSADESRIFRWLSVFVGGFTLEAAEDVCRVTGNPDDSVLDHIASLEEKSLLMQVVLEGEPRFVMLETIREYAAEKLAEGSEEDAKTKHAEYFYSLTSKTDSKLIGETRVAWQKILDREHYNIRSALVWCFGDGKEDLGIDLIAALDLYWQAGHLTEAVDWCTKAIEAGSEPSSGLARVLCIAGHNSCNLGDTERGMPLIERGLAMARNLGDANRIAYCLSLIGAWSFWNGDNIKATMYLEECVEFTGRSEKELAIYSAQTILGQIAASEGDLERAVILIKKGIAHRETASDKVAHNSSDLNLGVIAMLRGDLEGAKKIISQCLKWTRQTGNQYLIARALGYLGSIFIKQGDPESAKAPLGEATRIFGEMTTNFGVAFGLEQVSNCLILYAEMARLDGHPEQSARLLGAAASFHEPINWWEESWLDWFNEILTAIRARLKDEKIQAIWQEGRAMTPEEAVNSALAEEDSDTVRARSTPDGLSNREVDVAVLLVEGLTNREIGERLYISERTVANHVQSVLNKTASGNRAEAAAYAIRNGLTN